MDAIPAHGHMGAGEIRKRLGGLSESRVYQITNGRNFPKPVAELSMGNVWHTADVEAWIAEHRPELAEEPEGA
jgi:predicted DNA-binding transcriptional regulator AlpA